MATCVHDVQFPHLCILVNTEVVQFDNDAIEQAYREPLAGEIPFQRSP